MYEQLPISCYPKTAYISPLFPFLEIKKIVSDNDFEYPVAVKPDVGMMGFMFRKIDGDNELNQYHNKIGCDYIIQELVSYPMEVSVFYYRLPDQQKGTITGFLKKDMLDVVGDGKTTLTNLMLQLTSRPGFNIEEWRAKHAANLNNIIPAGEIFRLSWAANLSRGSRLISLKNEKDERLLKVFDDLSNYTQHFYYGRYDIKCNSIEELKNGKFCILEYNGCGAEPHHIYGAGNNLWQAYRIILHHWNILYRISKYNHQNGIKQWKFTDGFRFLKAAKKHLKKLRQIDAESM